MSSFFKRNTDYLTEDTSHRSDFTGALNEYDGRERLDKAAVIDLDRIEADPQHREHFDPESLKQLSASLKEHGQLQPVRVRYCDDRAKYIIVAGERRFRAAALAGFTSLECTIVDRHLTDAEILREQIVENALREDLLPSEQGKAFRDLMTTEGMNGKQLAEYLHIAPSTVSRRIAVLDLPEDLRTQVDSGELSIKDAIKLAKAPAATPAAKPKVKRQQKSKERKIVINGFTVTVKARRILDDALVAEALELAKHSLTEEAQQRKAA